MANIFEKTPLNKQTENYDAKQQPEAITLCSHTNRIDAARTRKPYRMGLLFTPFW